jgi:hypothetical protein
MDTNLLNVALGSIKTLDVSRAAVAPGTYLIDEMVRVSGTMTVGTDYDTAPTVSLPLKEILALFVARAGCTREASIALLLSCVRDAIAEDGRAAGEIAERSSQVEEALETVKREVIDKLPRQPRRGAVKAKLTVEVVQEVFA